MKRLALIIALVASMIMIPTPAKADTGWACYNKQCRVWVHWRTRPGESRYHAIQRARYAHLVWSLRNTWHADWRAVGACEWRQSNWRSVKTRGGSFYFKLQFAVGTWDANRGQFPRVSFYVNRHWGPGMLNQWRVAERVLARQGPRAWPHCFRR